MSSEVVCVISITLYVYTDVYTSSNLLLTFN